MSSDRNDIARQIVERSLGAESLSPGGPSHVVDGRPIAVVARPRNVDGVSVLLTEANAQGTIVMPVGGGTRLSLGNMGQTPGIALDTTALNQPVSINSADLTATFEAGMTLQAVQEILAESGQFLAMDSARSDQATIGGILASGASGPLKWQYGNPRDLVIGMKVVQADGTITKSGGQVVKNVSGYDMARLHVGGMGTLGIICEVSFKLTPKPANEKTALVAFSDLKSCCDAAISIFNSQVAPLALTVFDSAVLSASSIPDIAGDHFLAVRLGGRSRALTRMTDETIKTSQSAGATNVEILEGDSALDLWKHLSDFGWEGDALPNVVVRASLLPNQVKAYVDAIGASSTGVAPSCVASPGYGNVMVFWRSHSGADDLESSRAAIQTAQAEAVKLGGSAIIERCPVELKSELDVWGEAGDSIEIMRRLKQQYDPKGILSPGRFIGGI
ncbi:MAG: FAD-binding oxidoreductase [SAR202 cluster bacterium]|jgi:glycolate oxidase FAD binding subunit|nr:FAD-binding oxidoreductase [SAR202 cluster bacterium]MDP6715095.1 FAD-binding oxidoreductase [SAR202 cluster bacterium]